MSLKTVVKVGNISNLSDARYCAGMGVDFLGFRVSPTDSNYVAPEKFQEFRGWFSGPKVVAELYGAENDALLSILEQYAPDYLEVSLRELPFSLHTDKPLILSISEKEFDDARKTILGPANRISYILLPSDSSRKILDELSVQHSILILLNSSGGTEEVSSAINLAHGIALSGSAEEKPGLKSYKGLADVLEFLEVED